MPPPVTFVHQTRTRLAGGEPEIEPLSGHSGPRVIGRSAQVTPRSQNASPVHVLGLIDVLQNLLQNRGHAWGNQAHRGV
jgi:hypothetical protein